MDGRITSAKYFYCAMPHQTDPSSAEKHYV